MPGDFAAAASPSGARLGGVNGPKREGGCCSVAPLELTSVDGLRLDAAIHRPDGHVSVGTVIQAHGITADMDEGGMFVDFATRLAEAGFTAVRFSFRGHGKSDGTQRGMTIAGEMLDLEAAIERVTGELPGPLSIVAASFGAVSSTLSLSYLEDQLRALVLWNPVLNLHRTFLEPELPWGLENFGPEQLSQLKRRGYLLLDGEFHLGRVLFEEFRHYQPDVRFAASGVPALIVHGDRDSYVSYDIARTAATGRRDCAFHPVRGSDHGFDSREREDEAIRVTVDWLARRHAIPA